LTKTTKTSYFALSLFLNYILLSLVFPFLARAFSFPTQWQHILTQLFLFGIPILLYFFITKKNPKETLSLNPLSLKNGILILFLALAAMPTMALLATVSSLLFSNEVTEMFFQMKDMSLLSMLFIVAVIPSVMEELFFRGVTLSGYSNLSEKKACVLTGLLFGLMHMDGQQFLYAFVVGSFFCFLVKRTGSIFASMLAHFCINGTQVVQAKKLLSQLETMPTDVDISPIIQLASVALPFFISLPFLLGLIYLFCKHNPPLPSETIKEKINLIPLLFILIIFSFFVLLPLVNH